MTLLTPQIQSMIGSEAVYVAPEEIGRASFRYFAMAIGDDNPLWIDDDHARSHGYSSVIAPPTLVCETNQYMTTARDENGYIGHTWEIPVEGCRMIRGGNAYEFFRPVLPTDRITARWRIEDITERNASDGSPMLILLSLAIYENQDGEELARNTETIIYQKVIA